MNFLFLKNLKYFILLTFLYQLIIFFYLILRKNFNLSIYYLKIYVYKKLFYIDILSKLDRCVEALVKKLADKIETKKVNTYKRLFYF